MMWGSSTNNEHDESSGPSKPESENQMFRLAKMSGGNKGTREFSDELKRERREVVPALVGGPTKPVGSNQSQFTESFDPFFNPKEEPFWRTLQRGCTRVLVPIGMAATTFALCGGLIAMTRGNSLRQQQFMRWRVMAQFGTVGAMVLGFTGVAVSASDQREEQTKHRQEREARARRYKEMKLQESLQNANRSG